MGKKREKHKIKVTSFAPDVEEGVGKTLHVTIDGEAFTYETWHTHNSGGTELYGEDGDIAHPDHADCCGDRLDELSEIAEETYWATMMRLGYAGMVVQAEVDVVQACKQARKTKATPPTQFLA